MGQMQQQGRSMVFHAAGAGVEEDPQGRSGLLVPASGCAGGTPELSGQSSSSPRRSASCQPLLLPSTSP